MYHVYCSPVPGLVLGLGFRDRLHNETRVHGVPGPLWPSPRLGVRVSQGLGSRVRLHNETGTHDVPGPFPGLLLGLGFRVMLHKETWVQGPL